MQNNNGPLVTVIIPYFQRKPGILRSCVRSILAQGSKELLHIVIADDESPVSPDDELSEFSEQQNQITVVRRPNGGPGAARNTALEHLPPNTSYVALMDSDDAWEVGFLETALSALERGYDLFFSNSKRYSNATTRFDYDKNPRNNLYCSDHNVIDEDLELFEFNGDFFDFLVRRSNILGPSTTVYRRSVAADLRFREQFFNGQDRVFKLELGKYLGKVAFTPRVLGIEGEGVNIFDSSNWGSEKSISLLSSYIEMSKFILREIPLSNQQLVYVKAQLADSRSAFIANILHRLFRREPIDSRVIKRTVKADPMTFLLIPPNVAKAVLRRLKA